MFKNVIILTKLWGNFIDMEVAQFICMTLLTLSPLYKIHRDNVLLETLQGIFPREYLNPMVIRHN